MTDNRPRTKMIGWLLLPTALFFLMVCLAAHFFIHPRSEPTVTKTIDSPARPKLMRQVRENAPHSEQAKKLGAKADDKNADAVKSHRCVKRDDFDAANRIRRQEVDDNCDGVVDYCYVEELNEYGEDIRHRFYKNCGSEMHICTEIERNEYGEEISTTVDLDCDGRPDVCETYKRNDHGDVIEETDDRGCDGVLGENESHWCAGYDYNADGLMTKKQEGQCGEVPKHCSEFEYDLAAGIQRQKMDHDCDGTTDVCMSRLYSDGRGDGDYNLFVEKDCKGTWDWCNVKSEDRDATLKITGHEACAKKYDETIDRNRAGRP